MISPAVRRHFDRVAGRYVSSVASGPVARLRRAERAVLRELLDLQPQDTVLDAGCGAGFDAEWLVPAAAEVVGIDGSEAMVEQAKVRGEAAILGDLEDLDLRRTFTKVLCSGALEFCEAPEQVLERLASHTAPGGTLVLLLPTRSAFGLLYMAYHFSHRVRVRLFDPAEVQRLLARSGFERVRIVRCTAFSTALRARRQEVS